MGGFLAGLLNAAGDPTLSNRAEDNRQHAQKLSDQHRLMRIQEIQQTRMNLGRMMRTKVNTDTGLPLSQADIQDVMQRDSVAVAELNDLWNGHQDPNKPGQSLNALQVPQTNTAMQPAVQVGSVTLPSVPATATGPNMTIAQKLDTLHSTVAQFGGEMKPYQNKVLQGQNDLEGAGISHADAVKSTRIDARLEPAPSAAKSEAENWQLADIVLADGRTMSVQRDLRSGHITDLAGQPVPSDLLSAAKVVPKSGTTKPLPGQKPVEIDGKWYQPIMEGGKVTLAEMPEGWTPNLADKAKFEAIQTKRAAGQHLTADDLAFEKGFKATIQATITDPKVAGYKALADSKTVMPVNPDNPQEQIYDTAGNARRKHLKAPGSVDYKMQMPTAQERGRADLAMSAREQIGTMEGILRGRADLFGPGSGHITNFNVWVGSQDPDAQRFKAAARIAADHLAGVFGGRSQAALEAIYEVIGKNTTNPAAAIAGLEQMEQAAARIESRGAIGGNQPSAPKPIVQRSKSSGQYRYSVDGGQTWQPGQPPQK